MIQPGYDQRAIENYYTILVSGRYLNTEPGFSANIVDILLSITNYHQRLSPDRCSTLNISDGIMAVW